MDELEAIEAELKECLQELDNDELPSSENDGGADMKSTFNGMKTESASEQEGGRKLEKTTNTFQPVAGRESEKVVQWRAAFQKRVAEKDVQEEKVKALWTQQAKKDLEEFYSLQADSIRKSDKKNEETTSSERLHRNGGLGDGGTSNIWKRVADLCDFGTKAKTAKDVSRMRSVILALSEPTADVPSATVSQKPEERSLSGS